MKSLTAKLSSSDKTAAKNQSGKKMKKATKGEKSVSVSSSSLSPSPTKGGVEREEGGEKYVHCALLGDGMVGKTCLTLRYTQHAFTEHYTATVFDNYPVPVCVGGEQFTISVFDSAGQKDYESLRAYTYQSSEVLVLCFSVSDRESFYSVLHNWLPEIQRHTKGRTPLLLVGTQVDLRSSSSSLSSDLGPSSPKPFRSTSTSSSICSSLAMSPSSPRNSVCSDHSSCSDLRVFSSFPPSPSPSRPSSSCPDEVSWEEGSQLAKMIGADCYIECSARSEEGVQQVFEHVVFSTLKYRKKKSGILGKLFGRSRHLSGKVLQRAASTLNIPVGKAEDTR
ncbi:hypothetical protein ACOMHN_020817 [Nucella lapillus]